MKKTFTHHCGRTFRPRTRREMLGICAQGFGAFALTSLMGEKSYGASVGSVDRAFAPKTSHFEPKAKNVIFLYMDGGPSQVDTFDPKPMLDKYNGKPYPARMEPTQFDNRGTTMASPWKFSPRGKCGLPVSDLFPYVSECIDDICVIRSMTSNFSEHTNANYFLHTGNGQQGHPSIGAWFGYGLGSLNENLPGFIVLNGGLIPPGGLDNFNTGYLPATYQGTVVNMSGSSIENIQPSEPTPAHQKNKLNLLRQLDQSVLGRMGHVDQLESSIANYEMAYRMQGAVPELMDMSGESEATKELYGVNSKFNQTSIFGRECLLARRLIERGVRFVELTCPGGSGDRWDQHGNIKDGHTKNARAVDQPIAALIKDLKARGLFEETLLVWTGEFGRTPFAQGSGRDHNPFGFSLWMAGAGVKGGMAYGATDEFGYKAVENKVNVHDLHATMLHLVGMNHKKLTVRFSARDMRLTDVHGEVLHDILA
ncbi:MAG: DUF1501 domain-containing protein [Planctomycetota bacterium]|nr:DUF1501 domain-containing protein [Planctomycetota bacterium]MDA1139417.1 DUF1501 domain-containing protein [Planctomycetota bacterium]